MYESYNEEEEHLKNEWKDMCRNFQQKSIETNERLARKFYQLFKEQGIINYDDVSTLNFSIHRFPEQHSVLNFHRNFKNKYEAFSRIPTRPSSNYYIKRCLIVSSLVLDNVS